MILSLAACQSAPSQEKKPELLLKQTEFSKLPGWSQDDLATFSPAFIKSCTRIMKGSSDKKFGPLKAAGTFGDWKEPCEKFLSFINPDNQTLHTFFETYFIPYVVNADKKTQGLFTGYYEASLKGSRQQSERYNTPLYKRADDLVMVQLGEFRDDLKGRRIAGRVIDGKLKPYESREQIVNGDWPHNDQVLVWVDDPVDAFFVQIQGSGVVELDDGATMRIGYAGQNGHPYYAIGRELIKRDQLTKKEVSLQTIRTWLESNPEQAYEIMNTNQSYVFFRELESDGPLGGEGVALTPGRSLAIDRSLISYGIPIWTDIESPIPDSPPIQRLMVTQDTGGAIRGPVRGDVFWGYGETAEKLAGPMKSKGRYWILIPK
ncbi:MAG: murein transglycosylase A [Bdellovibrionales bacterium]